MRSTAAMIVGSVIALAVLAAGAIVAAIQLDDTLAEPLTIDLRAPRVLHLAGDGRILAADAGTGANDGRVVAIDPDSGSIEVLIDELPSGPAPGRPFGDIAGPTAAQERDDGSLCVLIGGGPDMGPSSGQPFNTLRCQDGPGFAVAELGIGDGFDFVPDGSGGWFVSSPSFDRLLGVPAGGPIYDAFDFFALFVGTDIAGREGPPYVPLGLDRFDDGSVATALRSGAIVTVDPVEPGQRNEGTIRLDVETVFASRPVDVSAVDGRMYILEQGEGTGEGRIVADGDTIIGGLDEPASFIRLDDGRFAVSEPAQGRIRIFEP